MNRSEFERIKQILLDAGIDRLYHVTDGSTWKSIKDNNGLRSAGSLANREIPLGVGLGDTVSRVVDKKRNLSDYIHLSFTATPPELQAAIDAGKLINPIALEISLEVLLDFDTLFSSDSPCSSRAELGPDFERIIAPKISFLRESRAEALIKSFIPFQSILNKVEIDNKINGSVPSSQFQRSAIIFLIDQSISMGRTIVLNGRQEPTIAGAITRYINSFIDRLLRIGAAKPSLLNKYDIAIVGYGDGIRDGWAEGLPFKGFVSTEELRNYTITHLLDSGNPAWVSPAFDCFVAEMEPSFRHVKEMIEMWLADKRGNAIPPLVVHFTDAEKLGMHSKGTVKVAKEMMAIETRHGAVEIWNIQLNPYDSHKMVFPTDEDTGGLDAHGHFLFQMSSRIQPQFAPFLSRVVPDWAQENLDVERRAMFVNSDLSPLEEKIGISL